MRPRLRVDDETRMLEGNLSVRIANLFKQCRLVADVSQEAMAEAADLDVWDVRYLESGPEMLTTLMSLTRLAKSYGFAVHLDLIPLSDVTMYRSIRMPSLPRK